MISIAYKQVHCIECYQTGNIHHSYITFSYNFHCCYEHFVLKVRHWKSLIAPLDSLQFITGKQMNAILVNVATQDMTSRMISKAAIRK
jgi:hypothetical protein